MNEKKAGGKAAGGAMRLSPFQKWLVFSAAIGVWLSGILWLFFKYFMQVKYEFGMKQHPLEPLWQKFHGGFAYIATFAVGMLWGIHVVKGWDMRWRRLSGGWLFGTTLFLILSGGALYYINSDDWKNWTAIAHWAVGIGILLLFLLHWLSRSLPKRG